MGIALGLQFFFFILLFGWTLVQPKRRAVVLQKEPSYWLIDLLSISIQGIIIPLVQTYILYKLYFYIAPQFKSSLNISPIIAFFINFVFVDYAYYLVHRSLHSKYLWGFHLLHHSAEKMDVIVSSRNTVWTSFLLPYIWLNSIMLYLLADKSTYLLAISITAVLDLWKHSELTQNKKGYLLRTVSKCLITPHEHSLHHGQQSFQYNFGANLSLWDRLHSTYKEPLDFPRTIGIPTKGNILTKLFCPFKLKRENQ